MASVVSVVDPENCLTKLLYLRLCHHGFIKSQYEAPKAPPPAFKRVARLYRFEGEDDYPYFPRKLGACDIGFNFETGSVAGGIF